MISIALQDKTVEVSGINTSFKDGKHQLWGTKKSDGKSFTIIESADKQVIEEAQAMINAAIDAGEFLADFTKEVK